MLQVPLMATTPETHPRESHTSIVPSYTLLGLTSLEMSNMQPNTATSTLGGLHTFTLTNAMQLQSPSHLDARIHTTLKDIMPHREQHHGSSLHNDTAPQRNSLINTYTKSQSLSSTEPKWGVHLGDAKTTPSQTKRQSHRHTPKHTDTPISHTITTGITNTPVHTEKTHTQKLHTQCTPGPTMAPLYGCS